MAAALLREQREQEQGSDIITIGQRTCAAFGPAEAAAFAAEYANMTTGRPAARRQRTRRLARQAQAAWRAWRAAGEAP